MNKPNVILVYADDLGRGMLSCYGQKQFQTPNIDKLASGGMKMSRGYGCAFCAPARASLLTGYHDCHKGRWTITRGNIYTKISAGEMTLSEVAEIIQNTGIQAGERDLFLPEIAAQAGYVTGEIGKLEWGFATTAERIKRHGWDYHYGMYDHVRCHGFYPPFMFENGAIDYIKGNTRDDCGKHPEAESPQNAEIRADRRGKAVYSQDIFDEKILAFLRKNRNNPFFLYHPTQLPHGPVSIPEIHPSVKGNPNLTDFEKEYASMVLRLDQTVGMIIDELDRLGISENTLLCFCSDNGHELYTSQPGRTTKRRSVDGREYDEITHRHTSELGGDVFNGNDGLAGLKWHSWEGGVRIPFIAYWPGKVEACASSDHLFADYDFLATLADVTGQKVPDDKDGVSFLPALTGGDDQRTHEFVLFASPLGPGMITQDHWKLRHINSRESFQLYNTLDDYAEENDLSGEFPDRVEKMRLSMLRACDDDLRHGTPDVNFADYVGI